MKILMISSYLPYPLFSGGQVRLYNLIKELSSKHEITLICEKRSHQKDDDVQEVEKICKKVIVVPRRNQWSLQNLVKSGISSHSFLVTGHIHKQMQQAIQRELAENSFDVIHVETFYVMQNVPENVTLPIVLVDHNIEYSIYQKFVNKVPLVLRPLLLTDIAKIKREEESAWHKATKVIAVSNEDKKVMEQQGIVPTIVANGVNTKQFHVKNISVELSKKEKRVLFIGDFSWIQNTDSVKFIIENIWPKLRKSDTTRLWIVSRHIPDVIRKLTKDPRVLFDEESSIRPTPGIFREASVLLAPIRVGGGTSYKILEAMSSGTPVVTMPLSAEAIGAKDGEHLMVGKQASELAEKTVQLLRDGKLYERIARSGRKLIEDEYTWESIAKDLERVYKESV